MRMRFCELMFVGSMAVAGCGNGESTDELVGNLSSTDANDRVAAVRQLQSRKGDASKVVPALIESLKDKNGDARWSAVIGLGYFGAQAKSALRELEKLKSDKDRLIRDAAKVAIERIGGQDEDKDPTS